MARTKLKNLLSEVLDENPKVDKHKVVEGVAQYSKLGKKLYSENSLLEIAKSLIQVAESAHTHILGEQDDWFDKVTVNKNMKALKGQVSEFKKVASEANAVNQRLTALYEDMGHILNRYYDINEELDEPEADELDNDFEDRKDKDIDNDGDVDDSDEYFHKKRQAISKAIKKEGLNNSEIEKAMKETAERYMKRPTKKLKDINNVQGVNPIGYFGKKKL